MKVIKRDGSIVDFDETKIVRAVRLSANRTHKVLTDVEEKLIVKATINDLFTRGFKDLAKVDDIHLSVENVLWTLDRDLYSEYRSYNNYKKRFNHSFNNILKNAKNIVYEGDKENANKDSCLNSTKMTLTSELAGKEMYLEYELPKHLSEAHKNMDFYIHDTGHRFYNMVNCIDENGWIYFKDDKGIKHIQLKDLDKIFNIDNEKVFEIKNKCYVLGRNGWTRLKAIHKRKTNNNDDIYTFKTRTGMKLRTTGEHRIPVIRKGEEITLYARDINKDDVLLTSNGMSINPYEFDSKNYINLLDLEDSELNLLIVNLRPLQNYLMYKYQTTLYDLLDIPKTTIKRLTISQFKEVMNKVEIPYEMFFKLRLKAKHSKNPLPLIIPVNESLAKLYGYVYADGGVYINEEQSTYHLTFTNTNLELIKDCQKCFEDCFDIKPSIIKPSGTSPCYRLCIGSRVVAKLFKDFCEGKFNGSSDISIPNFIVNGSRTIKLAFLSSIIDCDGSLGDGQITYVSCSLKYTEQIVHILKSLGYHASYSQKDSAGSNYYFKHYNGKRNYDSYRITISRKEEIYKLYNELSTFKKNQTYDEYESEKSQKFIESKILDIRITKENINVYDLQTESGWFIVNDYVVHNCCLLDVANIYKDGYNLNGEFIKEPKTIEVALDQLIDIILIASSQQYGGLTIPEIDNLLEPYAQKSFNMLMDKYDGDKEKSLNKLYEIMFRCFKRIQFKIKCVINAGGQTAFVTWTFGTNTSELGRLIVKTILDVRKQYMAVFPKLIYLYHSDISGEGSPNHSLYLQAIRCSMTQLYPDYCSAEKGYLKEVYDRCGTIISAMGCRAYLSPFWDENGKERYIGRANLGAVSLALPRYAIMSEGNKDKFFEILDKYFDYAMEVHNLTYEKMRKVKAKTNPLMFCEGGGLYKLDPEDTIEKALEYMTYSIGYIGLTEVCYYMTGKHLHEDNSFAIEVLKHLNKRIDEEKEKTGKLIALYATPSEGYCDKLLKADRKKFGIIPYLTDKKWYHNSFHVGSNFDITATDKQLKESPLFHLSNGGHIVYNEFPMTDNFEAFKQIIDFAMNEGLYYGVNVENNTCNECGFVGDFKDQCPKCNSTNTTSVTRCCGYLGYKKKNGDTRYNEGKDAEVDNRVKHFNYFVNEGDINAKM